jgi:fructose/tagatose bisphosphate aldolase
MSIVTERKEVVDIYAEAAGRHWVIPAFGSENLTTTEAVLSAVKEYGERSGLNTGKSGVKLPGRFEKNVLPHRTVQNPPAIP